MAVILFLKAKIPGGAAADLFSAPVMVAGHVNPKSGTYVAPHASHRLKRRAEAETPDLFSAPPPAPKVEAAAPPPPAPAPEKPPAPTVPPAAMTHVKRLLAIRQDLADRIQNGRDTDRQFQGQGRYEGEVRDILADKIKANDEAITKFRGLCEKNGVDPDAVLAEAGGLPDLGQIAPPPEPQVEQPAVVPPEPEPEPAASTRAQPFRPTQWGMPRGVKASARVKANREAERLLDTKTDEAMTDADLETLARYTGWGGCGNSPNEYFTPPEVCTAMWTLVRNLGFQGGTVLEPSAGTGVFQQTAPDDAHVVAVELSDRSARINRLLNGRRGDEVAQNTLEAFAGWDQRKFDLVIGNPPFGGRDAFRYDDLTPGKSAIATAERYFLDTALDKTADGGLVAFVLPSGVMDNRMERDFRARALAKGQLLAAFRLPNTAFSDSHTQVTTDIIVMRKRPQAIAGALGSLTQMQQAMLPHWNEAFVNGNYMLDGPGSANVLGAIEPGWRAKAGLGNDITVAGSMADVPDTIASWQPESLADDTPAMEDILALASDRDKTLRASQREPYRRLQEGDTRVVDGVMYVLHDSRWHRAEEPEPEVIAAARAVGALLEPLVDGTAADPTLARVKLAEALDAFVAKHGRPAQISALADWTGAPRLPMGASDPHSHAEMVGREARRVALLLGAVRPDGSYSDAVTGRAQGGQVASVETLAADLALRQGSFTAGQLAQASARPEADIVAALAADSSFAMLPDSRGDTQRWTTLDQYLTGDLWPAHDAALTASQDPERDEATRARFADQTKRLAEAIGWTDMGDVPNIQVDSPFVTNAALAAWKTGDGMEWKVTEDRGIYSVREANSWRTKTDDLLEKILMRRGVRKDELDRVDEINQEFRDWLLSDPTWRAKIEERYNRTMRGFVPKQHSNAPIEVPGLSPDFSVNDYQWAGVRWALEQGKGIIAADVGLGKTARALIINQLIRSTGRAKKPAIVMPKSLLSNWYNTASKMFPDAKIMTIGETAVMGADGKQKVDAEGNKVWRDDNAAERRRKLASIAQEDHDFILMTLPVWNMLDLEQGRREAYEQDDFFTQRSEALTGMKDKKRAKAVAKAEGRAKGQKFTNTEGVLTLEDTGIDAVTLDEAQSMKNLASPEAGMFRDLKFLGAPGTPAKQATGTALKLRYIREKAGGKNAFLLTATPTKNSPLELYSMLQHVAPEVWTEAGIRNVDDFIARFIESSNEIILNVRGNVEEANVVSGFRNLDEVRRLVRRYVDRTTAADVGLKLPKPEVISHQVPASAEQRAAYEVLRRRLEDALGRKNAEGTDHPFSVMSDMQKAATDMRLLEPDQDHAVSPKIQQVAEACIKNASDGAQIVFSDYVQAHQMLRDQLIAGGMDPKRIGIINAQEAESSAERQRLADMVNQGKLDVLIGNTATMGEGLDLQKRTTDIHHVDIPWEPASMTQRNGRGLRQGNYNSGVRLHSYLTQGSADGYRWQSMMAKSDWQTTFWGQGNTAENLARGSMGRMDMLIFSAADPEEARQKFGEQMEQAKERMAMAKVADANRTWGRYRDAKRQLLKMQQRRRYGEEPGPMEGKLAERAAAFKATLAANPDFPWKDALDMADVAIDQKTGRIWRPGDEVEVAPDAKFRTYDNEPAPFIVRKIDEPGGRVGFVHAGLADENAAGILWKPMSDLRDGVTATKIDRDAARAKMEKRRADNERARQEAAAQKAREAAETERREAMSRVEKMMAGDGYASVSDVGAMSDDFIAQHGAQIQAKLREGAEAYKLPGYSSNHVVQTTDGSIKAVPTYSLSKTGAVMALPTRALRQQLIDQEVEHHMTAPLADHYSQGRRGAQGAYGGMRRQNQNTAADPSSNKSPAMQALTSMWGSQDSSAAMNEIAARVDQAAAQKVRDASTFDDALEAAGAGFFDHAGWGGMSRHHLQPTTAQALLEQAERHGMADKWWDHTGIYRNRAGVVKRALAYDPGSTRHKVGETLRRRAALAQPIDERTAA